MAGIIILAVAAVTARSVALAGFGLDSLIEIGASTVVTAEGLSAAYNIAAFLGKVKGSAELREIHRFAQAWEADASLRLHDGDTTALAAYAARARLRGFDRDTVRVVGWQYGDVIAVRALPEGGWSAEFVISRAYLAQSAELAYAGNVHVSQVLQSGFVIWVPPNKGRWLGLQPDFVFSRRGGGGRGATAN